MLKMGICIIYGCYFFYDDECMDIDFWLLIIWYPWILFIGQFFFIIRSENVNPIFGYRFSTVIFIYYYCDCLVEQ